VENRDYMIMLYDFYGDLFNAKQKLYFEEYYFNNLSLGEISENIGVSRNAISKVLHGICDKLIFYEEKLGMYSKNKIICDIIEIESNDRVIEMLKEIRR